VRTAIAAGYNHPPDKIHGLKEIVRKNRHQMNARKQEHFKQLLLSELQIHARHVGEEQARALEIGNDDAGSSDSALRDVIQELALKLGDRESKAVAEIDQALMRMKEGAYGLCVRCGKAIDERRLEAVPTARYDAACQTEIENAQGNSAGPSL
jgi:RNA polymerase-binding transcription factor